VEAHYNTIDPVKQIMAFAVNLYFNQSTQSQITGFWEQLDLGIFADQKYRSFRPHVSLCIFESINCADCECLINQISTHFPLQTLKFDHLGVFNREEKVLFLALTPTSQLITLQKEVYQKLSEHAQQPWDLYKPDTWVPHCTLVNDLSQQDLIKALPIALKIPLPLEINISQIGIIEFDPIISIFQVDISS